MKKSKVQLPVELLAFFCSMMVIILSAAIHKRRDLQRKEKVAL